MPVAMLRYCKRLDFLAPRLASALPGIIAQALDVPDHPDMRLCANDIEVHVQPNGEHDVNVKDLTILVFAHRYEERLKNLNDRIEQIKDGAHKFLGANKPKGGAWVWVHLNETEFRRIC